MAQTLKRKRSGAAVPDRFSGDPEVDSAMEEDDDVEGEEEEEKEEEEEEEEWQGMGDDAVAEEGVKGSRQDVPHHSSKLPTGEELRDIKDATDLYRSNSFKMQIDALLPHVRPKYQHSSQLDAVLMSLHAVLAKTSVIEPRHPLDASRKLLKKGIAVPYIRPLPTEDTKWKVAFEPPANILLVGSWATKLAVKAKDGVPFTVDIAVEMPGSIFQEKDYLNGRFFQKRAYYLSVIAAAVASSEKELGCEAFWDSTCGDLRLTTLVLRPNSDGMFGKLNVQIRIVPFVAQSPIRLERLAPDKSNIRLGNSEDDSDQRPTPLYNAALMAATTPKSHLVSTHALTQDVPGFSDALALIRVWAYQRGYGVGSRLCIRGFEGKGPWWAALLELLVRGDEVVAGARGAKRKPLGKGLSSYQLFKAALDFLARHNFSEQPVFVKANDGHRFPPGAYSEHPTFVDSTSSVNLLAGVPLSSLDMLKHDAKVTLEALNSSIAQDPFSAVFMVDQRDTFTRFDVVVRVDLSGATASNISPEVIADHGSSYNALIATMVLRLRIGLGNRAKAIAVLHGSSAVRPTSQGLPTNPSTVYLGGILDTEHAFRLVDHGPRAEEEESAETKRFRELWGEKAELRRFKDGSITESVVWEVKTAEERAHVPAMIIRHLLQRHLGITPDAVQTWQTDFDAMVKLPPTIGALYQARGASIGSKAALTAFDGLVKQMKALDDKLPLSILSISPASPVLRYTDVFVPVAIPPGAFSALPPSASFVPAIEVVIEFEKSGRWPDDLRAIQKIKLAFLERLAACLMEAADGLQARVVLGESVERSEIEDEAALDVVTAEGWAFRARIWHDREATLLDRIINDKAGLPLALRKQQPSEYDAAERLAAVRARETYLRRFIHAPRHHRALAALHHRFGAFAGTARLVKRWLAAHWLLGGHVSEEAAELLCAHVFLENGAGAEGAPGSKERGFARVVWFLKEWEWTAGLDVPLADVGLEGGVEVAWASAAKGVAWAIRTAFDPKGHMWTASGPSAVVARRVRDIAKATWVLFGSLESGEGDVKSLFQHPTEHYDFVVELDAGAAPRYYQNINVDTAALEKKRKYANAALKDDVGATSLPGFDPVGMFYRDLSRVYEDTFLLFHDKLGGVQFGGVWVPGLRDPRPFRVRGGYSGTPAQNDGRKSKEKEKGLVVLNELALLHEIQRLGTGIVSKLVIQTSS